VKFTTVDHQCDTMTLNKEQSAALKAIQRGRNIFLTGAGGTGKSYTIRTILEWTAVAGIQCAVTAMTGCASLLLNYDGMKQKAKTLHSWAGVGLAREDATQLAEAVARNRRATSRWKTTQILIVDEVSMMTPEFLEKLDVVARHVRKRPDIRFGGIQLVLAGDFCQLPPVSAAPTKFVFEGATWSALIDETHNLTQIVRQKDPVFQRILTEARMGALSPESITILESRKRLDWQTQEIRPTLLFSRNTDVDRINRENMLALEGERRTYEVETVTMDNRRYFHDADTLAALTRLDADAAYVPTLELCVGAQVMLLTNLDQERGLVNGSRGVVTGYSPGGLPKVRFLATSAGSIVIDRANWWLEDSNVGRSQIPLKVAYAISIHKGQGATLDSALIDIGSNTFTYGQAYVALSRCRSLEGLYIWRLDPRMVLSHPTVIAFYRNMTTPVEDAATEQTESWNNAPPAWHGIIEPLIHGIQEKIMSITPVEQIAPPPADIFAALHACPDPAAVRVIILGQDPYPTAGNAHGMAFSVRSSMSVIPASLKNIYKELADDLAVSAPTTGCLQSWANQDILLLNDVLTVEIGRPQSHDGKGWEALTAQLIAAVLTAAPHVVLLAWGRPAQKKLEHPVVKPLLARHTVLTAAHPSPLAAYKGFFGSKPFSQTNAALIAHGQTPIQWA